jgi:hypothetical protein
MWRPSTKLILDLSMKRLRKERIVCGFSLEKCVVVDKDVVVAEITKFYEKTLVGRFSGMMAKEATIAGWI